MGSLPVPEAVTYVLQASLALGEAHGRGIVHRDLKPANLFLTEHADGGALVKVLDFGISKMLLGEGAAGQQTLTATSMVMGSFAYMSPEQARDSRDVDARADVWALGVVLQKLVTGSTPFEANTASAYIVKIVSSPPIPLATLRPDAPPKLQGVLYRCLEKDRDARYSGVGELAQALSPFAPGSEPLVERIVRLDRSRTSVTLDSSVQVAQAAQAAPLGQAAQAGKATGPAPSTGEGIAAAPRPSGIPRPGGGASARAPSSARAPAASSAAGEANAGAVPAPAGNASAQSGSAPSAAPASPAVALSGAQPLGPSEPVDALTTPFDARLVVQSAVQGRSNAAVVSVPMAAAAVPAAQAPGGAAAGFGGAALVAPAAPIPTTPGLDASVASWSPTTHAGELSRRRPLLWVALGGVGVVGTIIVIAVAASGHGPDTQRSDSQPAAQGSEQRGATTAPASATSSATSTAAAPATASRGLSAQPAPTVTASAKAAGPQSTAPKADKPSSTKAKPKVDPYARP